MNAKLSAAGSLGYLMRIAFAAGQTAQRALQTFAEIGDRYGQYVTYDGLAHALLPTQPKVGLASLVLAERLAREIRDPQADHLASELDAIATEMGAQNPYAAAAVAEIRARPEAILQPFFDAIQADVAAGRLDPYAPMPEDPHDSDRR